MGIFDRKPNIEKLREERNVEGLIKAITHKDYYISLQAIVVLGEIGDKRAVEPLCKVLSDKGARPTGAACIALGKIGDAKAVKPLIEMVIMSGHDPSISSDPKDATEALAKIGEPSVEPLLEALLISWKKAKQRIVEALGEIGDERAVEPIIKFFGYSGLYVGHMDEEGRMSIVRALKRIGGERSIEGLEMARQDSSPLVRVAANEAIREIRARMHSHQMKVKKDVKGLIKSLGDEDSYFRQEAAKALGEIGDKRAVEPLIQALKKSGKGTAERNAVVWAIGELGDTRALETLKQALNDVLIRRTIEKALKRIESRKS